MQRRFCVPLIISCKTTIPSHNQEIDIDMIKVRTFLPKRSFICLFIAASISFLSGLPPYFLATTNLFPISIISSSQDCYINVVIQYINFRSWLFNSLYFSGNLIQLAVCIKSSFFPYCWLVFTSFPWCHVLFNHSSIEGHLSHFQ